MKKRVGAAIGGLPLGKLQDLLALYGAITRAGYSMEQVGEYVAVRVRALRHYNRVRLTAQRRPCTAAGCCGTQRLLPLNDTPKHYTGAILPDGSRDFSRPGPEAAIWYCDTCQELFDAPGPVRQIIAAEARRAGLVGRKSRDGGAN
jgi:hypothetical protein